MNRISRATLAVTLLLAGCGKDAPTGPAALPVSGSWLGNLSGEQFTMAIAVNGGVVSGTGVDLSSSGGSSRAITITGTYASPALDVNIAGGFAGTVNLHATVKGDAMDGTMTSPGYTNLPITFRSTSALH